MIDDIIRTSLAYEMEQVTREVEAIILGGACTKPATDPPPLTYDKLRAIYDYAKPETLTVAGERLEIYGFNVHQEHCPAGFTVLTEKQHPYEPPSKRGKLVIINEAAGSALIYDPPKEIA